MTPTDWIIGGLQFGLLGLWITTWFRPLRRTRFGNVTAFIAFLLILEVVHVALSTR